MPVPVEKDVSESTSSSSSSQNLEHSKPAKQATIGALFKKSSSRKKTKRSISPTNDASDSKKAKTEDRKERLTVSWENPKKVIEKCKECRQVITSEDIKMFDGDSNDAVEEFVVLVDPRLSLLSGDEQEHDGYDDRPQHKITEFSVYDKCGHLCAFDTGLIEKNVELYFSAHVKPIFDENPDVEGGIATKKMGPINEWWIAGFDGGENALIGFGTAFAEYILMRPAEQYASYMNAVTEKIYMSKIVIEFLLENLDAEYEELLNKLETTVPPENCTKFTEDTLLRHAQFLVEQVESYDSAGTDYDEIPPLITTSCMRDLIKLAGVTLGKRRQLRGVKVKAQKKELGPTLATTTPLVRHVFDTFFEDQIEQKDSGTVRRKRCGVCEVCQQPDCAMCRACKDMVKFGGTGKSKQCCVNRRCPNLAIQQAEDDAAMSQDEGDPEPILKSPKKLELSPKPHRKGTEKKSKVKWVGEPYSEKSNKKLFRSVYINEQLIVSGDFVKVYPTNPTDPLYICRVLYMWEDDNGNKRCHAQWMYRAAETVLGEVGDTSEVFVSDDCDNIKLGTIMAKCKVTYKPVSDTWFKDGGKQQENTQDEESDEVFYQKWYDYEDGLFADLPIEFLNIDFKERFCPCCERTRKKQQANKPILGEILSEGKNENLYRSITWEKEEYKIDDCVYLDPDSFKFKAKPEKCAEPTKPKLSSEDDYPELYRKSKDYIKGSNVNIAQPLKIGKIMVIVQKKDNFGGEKSITVKVRKFYRPENTHWGMNKEALKSDLNMLYWSDEEVTVDFGNVEGKCHVLFADDAEKDISKYTDAGPDRFYFKEAYDASTKEFDLPPNEAWNKGGKGKGKARKAGSSQTYETDFPVYEKVDKLNTLDIFAGCGGLSEGLHQVGVAESRWAIEFEPAAAQAYRLNNPSTTVFNADCNHILKLIMEGKETDELGQKLPKRGEVDMLCGGPPCQGFSGMNRFNHREYSKFKNSLVTSYLSYCDYFRPKFFILENVRNFVSFKKSMVLKLALSCLVKMGYQCEFGVLQAGSYGVPQTRRRAIIIAAAPGEVLPKYPEAQHVFAAKGLSLSVTINDQKYQAVKRLHTAPYRTTTVYDAMSDLPPIKNGANKLEIGYDSEPLTHFQKKIRGKQVQVLRDHVCKDMSPLVEARMAHIPCYPGCDWRDLPNKVIKLKDGSSTKMLLYLHPDRKQGPGPNGEHRGVCSCANSTKTGGCDPSDRQFNTLVPWCLPHTGNRHNNWAGLYGRLEWDGFFSTTVTNPEPMGKQGRVLHPEQHRVVSVRECSRSQGFPDSFRFYGNVLDKHRQIGNAVAPPMAAAIGQEIRKSIVAKNLREVKKEEEDKSTNEE